jgi:hypothetical protein
MKKMIASLLLNFALFYVLAPGTFFTLPPNGEKWSVTATHAALFAAASLVAAMVLKEGFLH